MVGLKFLDARHAEVSIPGTSIKADFGAPVPDSSTAAQRPISASASSDKIDTRGAGSPVIDHSEVNGEIRINVKQGSRTGQ
jgi:hypothetical protein